jgi:hypothetical protein
LPIFLPGGKVDLAAYNCPHFQAAQNGWKTMKAVLRDGLC